MRKRMITILSVAVFTLTGLVGVATQPAFAGCTTSVTVVNSAGTTCPHRAVYRCWRTGWPWSRHTVCGWV